MSTGGYMTTTLSNVSRSSNMSSEKFKQGIVYGNSLYLDKKKLSVQIDNLKVKSTSPDNPFRPSKLDTGDKLYPFAKNV